MKLNYETKFDIGDEVWVYNVIKDYLNCSICNGTGKIKIKNPIELTFGDCEYLINEVVCPVCDNREYVVSFFKPKKDEKFKRYGFKKYVPSKVRIRGIYVEYDSDTNEFDVLYEIIDEGKNCASMDSCPESHIFSSLEECQHECDILNENDKSYIEAKEHVYYE